MPNSTNQPSSAEDIFAPTDPAGASSPNTRPVRRPVAPYQGQPLPPVRSGGSPNRVMYLIIIVIVVILVIGGIAGLSWWKNRSQSNTNTNNQNTSPIVNNTNTSVINVSNENTNVAAIPNVNEPTNAPADADRDGLSDTEEANLGTNPQLSDTDGDGLSDLLEVRTYHSNPLMADTDGNGVSDGDEVSAGNNPTGSGSLYDISNKTINSN